ncbi:MAG: HD domain-containing protein [Acidimicrobiales bacterium]
MTETHQDGSAPTDPAAHTDVAAVAAELVALYRRAGGGRYDEAVTQTEHGLQAASHGLVAGAEPSAVIAALLHDIGHLLADDPAAPPIVDRRHELVGADHLARWFPPTVTEPIRLHVAAKRYLCAVEPAYHDTLSPASVRSLRLQGGPMTADEVRAFEALPAHATAVALRRWDEQAKETGAPTASFSMFEAMIAEVLAEHHRADPAR